MSAAVVEGWVSRTARLAMEKAQGRYCRKEAIYSWIPAEMGLPCTSLPLCNWGTGEEANLERGEMPPALESEHSETIAPSARDHWRWWGHALGNVASQLSPWSSCPGLFFPQENPPRLPSNLTQCLGAA